MFVSVTRLRLRSWLLLLPFFRAGGSSIRQARTASGFVTGATLIDHGLVFWTLTVWESEADMKAYRGAGAHREVMPYLRWWCSEAATTNFLQPGPGRPNWIEAHRRLVENPRFHTVDQPGPRHLGHILPPPATASWRDQPFR